MKDRNENNVVQSNTQPDPNKMTLSNWAVGIGAPVMVGLALLAFTPQGRGIAESFTATTTPVTQEHTIDNTVTIDQGLTKEVMIERIESFLDNEEKAKEYAPAIFSIMSSTNSDYVRYRMNKHMEAHPNSTEADALIAVEDHINQAHLNMRAIWLEEYRRGSTAFDQVVIDAQGFVPMVSYETQRAFATEIQRASTNISNNLFGLGGLGEHAARQHVGAWKENGLKQELRTFEIHDNVRLILLTMYASSWDLIFQENLGYSNFNVGGTTAADIGYLPIGMEVDAFSDAKTFINTILHELDGNVEYFYYNGERMRSEFPGLIKGLTCEVRNGLQLESGARTLSE